ncbi:MAG: NAD(P)H-dependent glycerol-3-phosphate dehydrogenase [Acidobacteriaceae bacterium]
MSKIAVIGSGAWGTAIAASLAHRGGHSITLWSHTPAIAEAIQSTGENTVYLPGFLLPVSIATTSDLATAVKDAEIIVGVMPSSQVRAVYERMTPHLQPGQLLISATKGIEDGRSLRMSEVIAEVLTAHSLALPCAVLSGPSFAQEVVAGSPTALTIAASDLAVAAHLQREFASPTLRLYTNDDVVGVELGGALKNGIALATGVIAGLELGQNSAAALITRGIAEVTRLAVACGGRRETLAGLAGLGDLVLTCTGSLSRNRRVGVELGRGRALPEILAAMGGKVAEGVGTTSAALGLARRQGVEMPITEQVDAILHRGKRPLAAARDLMGRPGKEEF